MRNLMTALLAAALASGAQAQLSAVTAPMGTQLLDCLQRGDGGPTYPGLDEQARNAGVVRLNLRFTAPDRQPEVELLFRAASNAMVDAAERHVRSYRLPCLRGAPVTAVQEFIFRPRATDPIGWTPLQATQDPGAPPASNCLRTPVVPLETTRSRLQREVANVFVDMRFTAPDAPPTVTLAYSSATSRLVQAVTDYVSQYRMPCLRDGAAPVTLRQHFQYRPVGVGKRLFKEAVALPAFLSNMKGIREQRVAFDFNTMGCPFRVAWSLGKPALDNDVGEVGPPDRNRAEFLAWLRGLEMDMPADRFEQLVGQTVLVDVGCGKLALNA